MEPRDAFWDEEPEPPAEEPATPERELTRDEVFVPEIYGGYLERIERDKSYMLYKVVKRTGWVGKVIVLAAVAALLIALASSAISSLSSW